MWQVSGQPRVVALLERSLAEGRLAHAYLIVGPRHVGKMTLAVNLAQALNCEREKRPCLECATCRRIAAAKHADVQVLGVGAERKEISIAQIKQLQADASLPPFEGKRKVFIIDGAERLSLEAANRLLKTLEEPLPHVLILLLTSREEMLLPTVVSRCQRLELFPLSFDAMKKILAERYSIAGEKLETIARISRGCLGWAIAALQDEKLLQERSRRLDAIFEVSGAGCEPRLSYAADLALEFSRRPGQAEEVLALWLDWWRDLLLVKTGNSDFVINSDRSSAIIRRATGYSLVQIKDFLSCLQQVRNQLEQNANPRLALDALVLSLPSVGVSDRKARSDAR